MNPTTKTRKTKNSSQSEFVYEGRDLEAMAFTPNYTTWILNKFKPYIGKSIVEVGSGDGKVTQLLATMVDSDILCIEPDPSEKAAINLKNTRVKTQNLLKGFLPDHIDRVKKAKADTFIYFNVMEHIEDDQAELELVYSLLPKNGYVLTFSPALNVLMSDFDRSVGHHRRYTLKEMKEKMQKAGFEITQAHYMDIAGVLPWYLKYTLLSSNMNPNDAKLYDSLVVPILRRFEPSKVLPFGKNILVIGKKVL